jgi:anti-sigma B factor antagonist
MRLKEHVEEGIDVFALGGEIDMHFAPVLRDLLRSKLEQSCPALILDFTDVQFIDSRGIAAILEYRRDAARHGGVVCLAHLSAAIRPIIEVVRLDRVLAVLPSVADAVAGLKSGQITAPADEATL